MLSKSSAVFCIVLLLAQSIGGYAKCHCDKRLNLWDKVKRSVSESSGSDLLVYGVKTAAVAGAAVVATPLLVSAAGFGAGGIAAGSTAAAFQSAWFGGTISGLTGAMFSTFQSIGAVGLGVTAKTAIVSASSAAVKLYDTITGKSDDENCDCCN